MRTKLINAEIFIIKQYADAGCIKRLKVPNKENIKKKLVDVRFMQNANRIVNLKILF